MQYLHVRRLQAGSARLQHGERRTRSRRRRQRHGCRARCVLSVTRGIRQSTCGGSRSSAIGCRRRLVLVTVTSDTQCRLTRRHAGKHASERADGLVGSIGGTDLRLRVNDYHVRVSRMAVRRLHLQFGLFGKDLRRRRRQ